jgi:hypothetical protein
MALETRRMQWKLFALVHNIGKILHYGLAHDLKWRIFIGSRIGMWQIVT